MSRESLGHHFKLTLILALTGASLSTKYFLTVPSKVIYDVNCTAVITAYDFDSDDLELVDLEYRGTTPDRLLHKTTFTFYSNGTQMWSVLFPWEKVKDTSIILLMTTDGLTTSRSLSLQHLGAIIIQTDKPIYAPGQTVRFRVLAVDELQRLSWQLVRVEIWFQSSIDRNQTILERLVLSAEAAFRGESYELPTHVPHGVWCLAACLHTQADQICSTVVQEFVVQDYVTPVEPNKTANIIKQNFNQLSCNPMTEATDSREQTSDNHTSQEDFISISLKSPVTEDSDGLILVQYLKSTESAGESITVTVVALTAPTYHVFTTLTQRSDKGTSSVLLPRQMYRELSSSFQIFAFYHKSSDKKIIFNSLPVCRPLAFLEINIRDLNGSNSSRSPKDELVLQVWGSPGMRVGLAAVDMAVLQLNNKNSLMAEAVLEQLRGQHIDHAQGKIENFTKFLQTSGLEILHLPADNIDTAADSSGGGQSRERTDQNTIRSSFPESWLFQEVMLDKTGFQELTLRLPDSITTWQFVAMGVSAAGGVCVSNTLEQKVEKHFFADVRAQQRVKRLEEVTVNISIHNQMDCSLDVDLVVSTSEELCFSQPVQEESLDKTVQQSINMLESGRTKHLTLKVIPLKVGEFNLTVNSSGRCSLKQQQKYSDVVIKTLHVTDEGQKVKRSIVILLDPEAKHVTFKAVHKNKIKLTNTATVTNSFHTKKKWQRTKIDLAMPNNIIPGTERCHILAFGDLMGDIVTQTLRHSRHLLDHPTHNVESVLGDLGPTVHALLYLKAAGRLDDSLNDRGHRFIRQGVTQLLRYRHGRAFRQTPGSPDSTWLTTAVLRTLCLSNQTGMAYIDKTLLDDGFNWLSLQVTASGMLQELDARSTQRSREDELMLLSDVLIALLECNSTVREDQRWLQWEMISTLSKVMKVMRQPLLLAKTLYALLLANHTQGTQDALHRLGALRTTRFGLNYWTQNGREKKVGKNVPLWYQEEAEASSVEATAYALLVFLEHETQVNIDSIGEWLVAQRGLYGAYRGAMDSTAAIHALAKYTLHQYKKGFGLHLDLRCNVSSGQERKAFLHVTKDNATQPQLIRHVPIGQVLMIKTQGKGLGQVHINVEYSVPVNNTCGQDLMVQLSYPEFIHSGQGHSCYTFQSSQMREQRNEKEMNLTNHKIGYVKPRKFKLIELTQKCRERTLKLPRNLNRAGTSRYESLSFIDPNRRPQSAHVSPNRRPQSAHVSPNRQRRSAHVSPHRQRRSAHVSPNRQRRSAHVSPNRQRRSAHVSPNRQRRSAHVSPNRQRRSANWTSSYEIIFINICLSNTSSNVTVGVEMLTGYQPVAQDLQGLQTNSSCSVVNVEYKNGIVNIQLTQGPSPDHPAPTVTTCLGFRAVQYMKVNRLRPGLVTLRDSRQQEPYCRRAYYHRNTHRGFVCNETNICRCFSGHCSKMHEINELFGLHELKLYLNASEVAYKLHLPKIWRNLTTDLMTSQAKVSSINLPGCQHTALGEVTLIRPSSCWGIQSRLENKTDWYFLSRGIHRFVDAQGKSVYQQLLDDSSSFLDISNDTLPILEDACRRRWKT
ncbi:uncharacterized protein LOC131939337 isoform X2 [Physella acuta]|uniref:uncharacterized protein LOC131939337 isoform X2 n=1 Tax=Physella acuta TaxID=109671 RepID=UPI0027DAFB32|nr:uncharacterized protein LOC131939337 isoform X2 [Physella acuta]